MELTVRDRTAFAATGGRPFDPARPVVVFLHGAGMDRTVWSLQTRWFAHHGRAVLAVDLPGHGRSAGPALDEIGTLAGWTADALDAAGAAGPVALVGHSMGALIALEMAARAPARVRSLALVGAAARMPVHPDLLDAAATDRDTANRMITLWGHGRGARLGGHRAPGLWMTGGAMRLLERAPPGVLHRDLAACNAYRGAGDACANVVAPTLVLSGRDDQMTPARQGERLAAAISGATWHVLPDCGHMIMVEQPDAVLQALAAAA